VALRTDVFVRTTSPANQSNFARPLQDGDDFSDELRPLCVACFPLSSADGDHAAALAGLVRCTAQVDVDVATRHAAALPPLAGVAELRLEAVESGAGVLTAAAVRGKRVTTTSTQQQVRSVERISRRSTYERRRGQRREPAFETDANEYPLIFPLKSPLQLLELDTVDALSAWQ
jgi:hypothetical protein